MLASNYWVTIDNFPYRLSEIYATTVPGSILKNSFQLGSGYGFRGDDDSFSYLTFTEGAWGTVKTQSFLKWGTDGISIPFLNKENASLPISTGPQLPTSNKYSSGFPFECSKYVSTNGTSSNSIQIRWGGSTGIEVDNTPLNLPGNPEGVWVFVQAAGGGGGGCDSWGAWDTCYAGGGGGSGAWCLLYLNCKKLYVDYSSSSLAFPFFKITLGAPGAAGTVYTSDDSAGTGGNASTTYVEAATTSATSNLSTLMAISGGKGGGWGAWNQSTGSGGSGGDVSIYREPSSFPYYTIFLSSKGSAGGYGIQWTDSDLYYSVEYPSPVGHHPSKQYGGAEPATVQLSPNNQTVYLQRYYADGQGYHIGYSTVPLITSSVYNEDPAPGGGGGASPCGCNPYLQYYTTQAGWGAGGCGGARLSGSSNVLAQTGGAAVAGVLTPWTPTGYQAFTSAPTLTAESNSGNLDMKITNSNSFATTVRVSINGGQAYEGAIAAGGSIYVRAVIGRSLPLYSSTYVRAIFTSGVNTSELATGYCTTSTDAGS